jgi:6-phosphogluconate dehydrogenase
MSKQLSEIGMVGLGVMGRNLVLNMADHGYSVVGYDKDPNRVQALQKESAGKSVRGAMTPKEFIASLRTPRAVMMLVPAGKIVDNVIRDLLPLLERGDLIVDGGNSYFKDTDLRAQMLANKGIPYLGVGISGGEAGARHGPSMMPGGPKGAYERVRAIFEAVAANVDGEPCVAYLGPDSAGHYVKMVHNGIEYGLMRLIAETYDLMKRGLGLTDDELADVYDQWNRGDLNSYLIEITANIFRQVDEKTGKRLVDVILDEAKQKGTGKWTSQEAMDVQVPLPTIDMAVAMRNLSVYKNEREEASQVLTHSVQSFNGNRSEILKRLHNALYTATIITFAQGMALLHQSSETYDYRLNLEDVARIWRGGCIIRAALLEKIRTAYRAKPDLPNLLLDSQFAKEILERQDDLRTVVCTAAELCIPATALGASLGYLDAYRSAWMPANLIQAQRDYFGAHTYERVDAKGVFHTEWGEA